MPHDRNGNLLNVGDSVMVPCRIKAIYLTEDYCMASRQRLSPFGVDQQIAALTQRWRYRLQRVKCALGFHVWARRRDGRICAYCEKRQYR